jgi:anti-sigma regulatory factor (Ser/Thr protein kinase)
MSEARNALTLQWEIDGGDYVGAAKARKDFAARLRRFSQPQSDHQAAVLIFGELIANALKHGRGRVRAQLSVGSPYAVLCVQDDGNGFTLEHVRTPEKTQLGGRGLFIVKLLAPSLRVARDADGFRVIAELPVTLGR